MHLVVLDHFAETLSLGGVVTGQIDDPNSAKQANSKKVTLQQCIEVFFNSFTTCPRDIQVPDLHIHSFRHRLHRYAVLNLVMNKCAFHTCSTDFIHIRTV